LHMLPDFEREVLAVFRELGPNTPFPRPNEAEGLSSAFGFGFAEGAVKFASLVIE